MLNTVTLLIIAVVMLRSRTFGRAAAWAGLLAGLLMLVPSNAGAVGAYMALASLPPWMAFCALVARTLFRLAGRPRDAATMTTPYRVAEASRVEG